MQKHAGNGNDMAARTVSGGHKSSKSFSGTMNNNNNNNNNNNSLSNGLSSKPGAGNRTTTHAGGTFGTVPPWDGGYLSHSMNPEDDGGGDHDGDGDGDRDGDHDEDASSEDDGDDDDDPWPPPQMSTNAFAPPFYGRPPTPLPPSPSLTSLLRPSRPTTPNVSDDEGLTPGGGGLTDHESQLATGYFSSASIRANDQHLYSNGNGSGNGGSGGGGGGAGGATVIATGNGPSFINGGTGTGTGTGTTSAARWPARHGRAPARVPTYEYYGFVLYLFSSLSFGVYLLWSYLPSPILHGLGITYYPNRWWSLAIPSFLVMALAYMYVALAAYNVEVLTLPLASVEAVVDEAAMVATVDAGGRLVRMTTPVTMTTTTTKTTGTTPTVTTTGTEAGERRGKGGGKNRISREREARRREREREKREREQLAASSFGGETAMRRELVKLDGTLNWREVWNEGTDAVMDVPLAGVCEVLYGEGREGEEEEWLEEFSIMGEIPW